MKKKIIGILICITLLISVLPVSGIIEYDKGYLGFTEKKQTSSQITRTDIKSQIGILGRNNSPPYQPDNPNPANTSVNISINADLNWTGGDPDGDPVTYNVYFGTNSTPPMVSENQSGLIYDPDVMNYSTKYYWYIIAWDNQSASNESLLWEFTTIQEPNLPPYKPSNPNPANESTDVSLKADLNWTGGDPNSGDTVYYDVYFGANSTPPKVSSNQTGTIYDPGILDENTIYYWQIIAWDDLNLSNKSDLWHFTTKTNLPPYQPFNESPPNGTPLVGINVDISWEGGDPDGDMVTYDVYFEDATPPEKVSSNQTGTLFDPGLLNTDTMYYWQIVAWDEYGAYNMSPIWTFSTAENGPPYPPVIISGPSVGGPRIELQFNAITSDPESDEVYYMWDWGEGNFTDWLGPYDISSPISTNYTWNSSGDYTIRVKAKDIHGKEGQWSDDHNISIAKQIRINNLQPGFIYFHILGFTGSYLFLQALEYLGITGVISTGKLLIVNATASEHVDSVKFQTLQILWNLTTEEPDDDMSDGCNAIFSIAAGLFQVTANAYDDDGNLIDISKVPYLIYFCRSKGGGGGISIGRAIANRLRK